MHAEIPPRWSMASAADKLVFGIYFSGVAICFALSATYHTVMNHSQKMDAFGAQLDFQGVILLMWGATVPLVYYGFACEARLRVGYWSMPRFRDPYLRPVRAATFGSLAIFTMVPVLHGIGLYGWEIQKQRMGIVWVVVTLGLNVTGATAYAVKFPERWCRRHFDLVGASHQVFHVLVVLAALVYMKGLLQAFDYVHGGEHSCGSAAR
ncbi:hypothetical protein BP6252_05222 [Coleophoma cylindrospora]|uniref:Uncharacterized protein n=1 Tax=Coleophoma cylindrospora TaxID=1849047 RepID=A0A3D8RT03_9HELO|nr:hypothetical protein BP6252_05222 [Coleophoma cylindrospora]